MGVAPAAAIVLPPLLWLGAAVLRAAALGGVELLDPVARGLLVRSLLLGSMTTLLGLLLGVPYGWLAARYALIAGRLWGTVSLLPLLLPPYCATLAWRLFFLRDGWANRLLLEWGWIDAPLDPHGSLPAAAALLAFSYWPVAAWLTLLAARSVPRELEDAARLHLPDADAARWAAGPALRRAVPAAALLLFVLALADFGVPNSLGVSTYPVDLVNAFQIARDPGVVARLAAPLLLVVLPLTALQIRLLDRAPVAPSGGPPRLLRSRIVRHAGAAWCLAVIALTLGVPLGTLAAYSLPLETYRDVWAESQDHFLNTLLSAGGGALLALGAALAYGWSTQRRRPLPLELALTLPYALPASLIGVAMIQLLNRPGLPGELYTSMGGLVWTYAALFYPFAARALQPAWGQVDPALLEEALVLGAGGWTRFRVAAWPALRGHALLGGGLAALLAAREIDATALLRIPGGDTLAFRIYDYLHFAPGPKVAALSILLLLINAAAAALLAWWGRSRQS